MIFAFLLALQAGAADELGAESPETRRAAEARLLARGTAALPDLLEALKHPDPEVRGRAFDLLKKLKPMEWVLEHLDHPIALDLFHSCHKPVLRPHWETTLRNFVCNYWSSAVTTWALFEQNRTDLPIFRVGRFRDEAPDDPHFPRERIAFDLNEGAILAGYPEDLNPGKPFCRVLLERLLKDPADREAACLLADVIHPTLAPVLVRALDRKDATGRVAFPLLLYLHAKSCLEPGPRFLQRLELELAQADWNLLIPASHIACAHGPTLAPTIRRAYASPNPWARYFAASIARVRPTPEFYSPSLFSLMREANTSLRREALFAGFAVAPRAEMDFETMVDAALSLEDDLEHPYSWSLTQRAATQYFREIPDRGLGLELVRILPHRQAFALAVLEVFEDPFVIDAFSAEALRRPDGAYVETLEVYARLGHERPLEALRSSVETLEEEYALEAARALARAAGGDSLGVFDDLSRDARPTMRRRALEGLWQLNTQTPCGTPLFASIVAIVTRIVEEEDDPRTRIVAIGKLEDLTGCRPQPVAPRMAYGRGFG